MFHKLISACVVLLVSVSTANIANSQNFRQGANFWVPPKNTSQCRSSFAAIEPFTLTKKLQRHRVWEKDQGPHFTAHYGMLLAETIAGRNVTKHKKYLLSVAGANTYTQPVFGTGLSPVFVQSNLMRITAMYIVVMESRGQLSQQERQILVNWGDKMIPGQKGQRGNGSPDSRMASGVAMMSWGNVTNDARLMKAGYRKFMGGYQFVLRRAGKLKSTSDLGGGISPEDEYNISLTHAVEGAAILRNLGIDVASQKVGGSNLHDAVAWWADVMLSAPPQFKGNKAWGHVMHIGWIPIYKRMYSEYPSVSKLQRRARKVTSGRSPTFRAVSLGGATDCLW